MKPTVIEKKTNKIRGKVKRPEIERILVFNFDNDKYQWRKADKELNKYIDKAIDKALNKQRKDLLGKVRRLSVIGFYSSVRRINTDDGGYVKRKEVIELLKKI